jgi:molybdate transport system ATP-binding protein
VSWHAEVRLTLGTLDLDAELRGDDKTVALIGPNGSGKTTLLRTIAGAHHPRSGHVSVGERVLFDSVHGVDLPPEERRVGYVPQGYGLFPHLSALDNVAFGARSAETAKTEAAALMAQMGCDHLAPRPPAALSGGEQQRVALARALMIDPLILLLDEPLAALDTPARRRLRTYLADHLSERAGPAIVVTHDARDVHALEADVYVMEEGRIVQRGAPDTLAREPASDFVAEFFDGPGPARSTDRPG